jgi:hypothetical protein
MWFKSKIKLDELTTLLLAMHGSVFGPTSLRNACDHCNFSFMDEESYAAAFWEWLAFGLYVTASGVRTYCERSSVAAITKRLNEQFYLGLAKEGASRENLARIEKRIRGSIAEYDAASMHGPIDQIAVQKVFDHPAGALPAQSMQAFELRLAIQKAYEGAMDGVRLHFKQFAIAV